MGTNRQADHVGAGGRRTTALPRRRSDRVADLVAWGLGVLALGALAMSILVGVVAHGDLADHADRESRDRAPITVVLTEDAPVVPNASGWVLVGVVSTSNATSMAVVVATSWPEWRRCRM